MPSCNDVRHDRSSRQNDSERAGPKPAEEFLNQRAILLSYPTDSLEPVAIRNMNYERIESGTVFHLKDLQDRVGAQRIRGEAVNGFGR